MQLEEYEIKDLDEDELTTYVTTINKEVAQCYFLQKGVIRMTKREIERIIRGGK